MKNKKFRSITLLVSLLFVILVVQSCYSPPPKTPAIWNYNFSSIYNPGESALHPEYSVYHNSDSSSLFFIKINTNELVPYSQPEFTEPIKGLLVKYVIRDIETNQITDSSTIIYRITKDNNNPDFITYFNIKTPDAKKYNMVVLFSDVIRKVSRRAFTEIDKTNRENAQNYFVEMIDSLKTPLFSNVVKSDKQYKIYRKRNSPDSLRVSYYLPINSIPQSPFASTYNAPLPAADTIFMIAINNTISFEKQGIYLLTNPEEPEEGLSLVNFGNEYPKIETPESMIKPLRYLTNTKRWNDMLSSDDKKQVVDMFWLNLTTDVKRARELIRVYYNRTVLANEFFGTYQPGWQTDRGMIYIVFGAPATIYKNSDSEQWIYGDNPELSTISFTFKKQKNPLTNNDFVLVREQQYQTIWSQAVETWLTGKAFSVN